MALVEKYIVVASVHPIDPDSLPIKEGMLVTKTSAGVKRVVTADINRVLGISADNSQTTASSMPGVADGWQNRVSDGFDETKASAKITVYHSGGEFATDQFVDTNMEDANIGNILVASTGALLSNANSYANVSTCIVAGRQPVAMLTKAAGYYPSGVPGIDLNGDMALGGENTNQYIEIKLLV